LLIWANSRLLQPDKVAEDAKFCVGQWLGFVPTWEQLPPYAGDPPGVSAPPAYDWTMSSKYVNRRSQPNSAGCVTYDVDLNLLKYWMPNAWYISGGDKNVRLNLTLQFDNEQSAKVTESGKFNVFRPSARPNLITGLWYLDPRNGVLETGTLYTSLALLQNPMDFKTEIYSQFDGQADYVQLLQGWNNSNILPSPLGNVPSDSADKTVPYGDIVPIGTGYWAPAPVYRDGPETVGGTTYVRLNYNYQVYLRFRPNGNPYNIPITLARIDWYWNGAASRPTILDPWNITTNDCPPPTFHSDDTFPFWVRLYTP
jgi:hypothetical protein